MPRNFSERHRQTSGSQGLRRRGISTPVEDTLHRRQGISNPIPRAITGRARHRPELLFDSSSSSDEDEEFANGDFFGIDDIDEDDESDFTFDATQPDTFASLTAHPAPSSIGIAEQVSKLESSVLIEKSLDRQIWQIASSRYMKAENEADGFSGEFMRVSGRVPSLFRWL